MSPVELFRHKLLLGILLFRQLCGLLLCKIYIPVLITLYQLPKDLASASGVVHCSSKPECRCRYDASRGTLADCSYLSLTSMPKFTHDVTFINLSHNDITQFPGYGEVPKNLIFLDLSQNNFSKFQNNSFKGMFLLETLNLQGNHLLLNSETYPADLFNDLVNLKKLNLKNNVGKNLSGQVYPDDTFSRLKSLEVLEIDGLENKAFGPGFSQLRNLHTFNISGTSGRCSIPLLTRYYFEFMPQLEIVDVSRCKILRIENGTFMQLKKLSFLDISYNEDLTFRVCANITYDLQSTSIKILKFNKIHQTFGVGTTLFVDDIKYLYQTAVEQLYLDSNRLEVVEKDVPLYIPNTVSYGSLADNKLTMGIYVLQISIMKGVKAFNGSKQYTSHDPTDLLRPTNPGSCDLQKRHLCNVYPPPKSQSTLNNQDKTLTLFKDILHKLKLGIDITIPISPNLETIFFSNCRLKYQIPKLILASNKVKYADFSGNLLYSWKGPVKNLKLLKYLDLSHNYCSYVSTKFFEDFGQLNTLILKENLLGFSIGEDENGLVFSRLKNLKYLDLSGNRIRFLKQNTFHGLFKQELLNISRNLLREWSFNFRHMKYLRFVDVSHNQLTDLPSNIRDILDEHSSHQNITIDLSDNNLVCSCSTLDFLKWILKTKVNFRNLKKYDCTFTNQTVITFQNLQETIMKMDIECSSKIGLISGVLAAILVSIIVIIGGIVYRYRWKIRYLYYTTKNRYLGYNPVSDKDNDNDHYIYDAFISYADEDRTFISGDMCRHLEVEGGCKLCIHHRDFVPGMEIAANITNAIHSSRKTVILLSKNFLKSYWCNFEFNMARMESIYSRDGRNVVFLVFYGDIAARDLPLVMMELIESRSYIEYPNDPQGNVVFWGKMKEAISKV